MAASASSRLGYWEVPTTFPVRIVAIAVPPSFVVGRKAGSSSSGSRLSPVRPSGDSNPDMRLRSMPRHGTGDFFDIS